VMRDASLERTSYGSLLDSPAFGALRDRGTTRRPTIPRQGSGRRVSSRLSVTRTVTAEGQPTGSSRLDHPLQPSPNKPRTIGGIVTVRCDCRRRSNRKMSSLRPRREKRPSSESFSAGEEKDQKDRTQNRHKDIQELRDRA